MLAKSTHLQVIPQQSTQNTANLLLQTYGEKVAEFPLLLRYTIPLLRLGALLRNNLQMGAFPSIDVCFYWLAYISEIDNRLVTACIVKTAT